MVERNCVVCGVFFEPPRKNSSCCSKECSLIKERTSELERRKRKRIFDHEYLARERDVAKRGRERNRESERGRARRWRVENPDKAREQRRRYRKLHPEKEREKKKRYRENHPESKVREYLKSQLGFTPPPDLVEEATALRLLNRVLKKAGD